MCNKPWTKPWTELFFTDNVVTGRRWENDGIGNRENEVSTQYKIR